MNPVIGLRLLQGSHTGANMAKVMLEVLRQYGVAEHIGYCVADNASNNDTLVNALGEDLIFSTYLYDASQRRLRCVGHVVNLVVRAFWFGEVDRALLQDIILVTSDTIAQWRRMGPWGEARNIAIYSLASPQRHQELKRLGGITVFQRDNATRWNSGYTMINSMLRNRDAIDVFCTRHSDLEDGRLDPEECQQLSDAIAILEPCQSATLRMEIDFSEIPNNLVELDFLRSTLTAVLRKNQPNPHCHIRRAAADAVVLLDKSWEIYKTITVCIAAVVLHPAYKWEYFEVAVTKLEWTNEELNDSKMRVQGLWLTQYNVSSQSSEGERQPDIGDLPTTPSATWRAQHQRELIGM